MIYIKKEGIKEINKGNTTYLDETNR